jgi:hypothetical protein
MPRTHRVQVIAMGQMGGNCGGIYGDHLVIVGITKGVMAQRYKFGGRYP